MQKVYKYKQIPYAANDMGTGFTKHLYFYSDSIKKLLLWTIITPIVFSIDLQLDAGSHVAVLLGVFHRWYYQFIHYQNDIGLNNSKGYFPLYLLISSGLVTDTFVDIVLVNLKELQLNQWNLKAQNIWINLKAVSVESKAKWKRLVT